MNAQHMLRYLLLMAIVAPTIVKGQSVEVSFGQKKADGHPSVFGMVIKSPAAHVASYQMLKDYGVKFIRATAPLNLLPPDTISLADYINDVNDVQDPDNWPGWGVHSGGNGDFSWAVQLCKELGFETMLSISYVPEWLAWGAGGDKPFHRVPKDWEVNQDLYKKTFLRYRDYIDIVGISNEPNFMEIDGSPYVSKPDAYKDMFKYASAAIREVDSTVKIVGPEIAYSWNGASGVAEYPENLEFVSKLVNAPDIPVENLNAISYHHYYEGVNIGIMDTISQLPVYVTEWNAGSGVANNTDPNMSGKQALSWVGNNLIHLLNQGTAGSAFYTHYPRLLSINRSGTYEWDEVNQVAIPHLNMRSFALLSKSLNLGEGPSEVKQCRLNGVTNALGAVNSLGEYIVALPNLSSGSQTVDVALKQLPFDGEVDVYFYEASDTADVFTPYLYVQDTVANGNLSLQISLPSHALGGIRIVPANGTTPNLSFVVPKTGEVYPPATPVALLTNASYLTPSVTKVEYFADGFPVAQVDTAPFGYSWTPDTVGQVQLSAKATLSDSTVLYADTLTIHIDTLSSGVELLGEWTTGLSRSILVGDNRVVVFTAHVEHSATISLDSVFFEGIPMAKISDQGWGSGYKSYVAAFYLAESAIPAGGSGSFTTVWSTTPRNTPTYTSAMFQHVDFSNPLGAVEAVGATSETIQSSPLSNSNGDMVVLASTTGEPGSYTMHNGFTKALELPVVSGDGVIGYRSADGSPLAAQVTHSVLFRQGLVAFVLNKAPVVLARTATPVICVSDSVTFSVAGEVASSIRWYRDQSKQDEIQTGTIGDKSYRVTDRALHVRGLPVGEHRFYYDGGVNPVSVRVFDVAEAPSVSVSVARRSRFEIRWDSLPEAGRYEVQVNGSAWGVPSGDISAMYHEIQIPPTDYRADYTISVRGVYAGHGCMYSKEATVSFNPWRLISEIKIPNAFSPNGDGLNDVFRIRGEFSQAKLEIFNAFGQRVFQTSSPQLGWDGTFGGRPAPMGLYIYRLEATTVDQQRVEEKGSLTLIR